MHAEDVLLEGAVLDEAVAAVGTDVVLLASVGHAVVPERAPRGEFLVAEVAGNGLLAVGLHVGSQGLVVLEPLGAQVTDDVPDLGVRLHVTLELVSAVGRLPARHAAVVGLREGVLAALGPNSKETIWLEFRLEKPLEFWLKIPDTLRNCSKMVSFEMSQNQNGISCCFSSRNSSQNCFY